ALAADARQRDFDAAFLADDAFVLHALVLAAQAFVILDRAEDAGAEQPVALRLEGAIIDRLGLLDLAERPRQNLFRTGDRYLDLVERLRLHDRIEEIHDLLIHCHLLMLGPARNRGKATCRKLKGQAARSLPDGRAALASSELFGRLGLRRERGL